MPLGSKLAFPVTALIGFPLLSLAQPWLLVGVVGWEAGSQAVFSDLLKDIAFKTGRAQAYPDLDVSKKSHQTSFATLLRKSRDNDHRPQNSSLKTTHFFWAPLPVSKSNFIPLISSNCFPTSPCSRTIRLNSSKSFCTFFRS